MGEAETDFLQTLRKRWFIVLFTWRTIYLQFVFNIGSIIPSYSTDYINWSYHVEDKL